MKKIVQINSVVNVGSTGHIVEELGQLIMHAGWKSFIAFGREARESESELITIGHSYDIYNHYLYSRFFDKHGLGSKNATKQLIRQLSEISPDLIHLHNIHGYYVNIKELFSFLHKAQIPVLWTLHDFWPITGHCAYIEPNCEKWISGCNNCPRKKEYPSSLLDNSFYNWHLKNKIFNQLSKLVIIPVSQWQAGFIKKSFLNKYPCFIIHNGIDIDIFKPKINLEFRKENNIENKFIILGVATKWTNSNGYKLFLQLSEQLKKDEIIILVGVNKSQIKKLPPNIIGIERTENVNQLVDIYSSADVFLNASLEVTFGLVTIESMACGTPAIVFDNTAGKELVNEKTGFVVHDCNGVLDAIKAVKENGKNSYMDACRHQVINKFNKSDRYCEYIKLYGDILNETFKWNKQ